MTALRPATTRTRTPLGDATAKTAPSRRTAATDQFARFGRWQVAAQGRELRELEQAILTQAPELDAPRARGRSAAPAARRRGLALIAAGIALAGVTAAVAIAVSVSSGDAIAVRPDSVAVIDPDSDRVIAGVPVGARPEALAADARSVWVANVADGTVSRIDTATRRVEAIIPPADMGVEGLAVGGGSAWIADSGSGRAVRLDAESATAAEAVRFPTLNTGIRSETPNAAAFGHGSLWVASARLAAVFRIDASSRRVRARLDVGNNPTGIAVGAGAVWVTDSNDNTLRRIVAAGDGVVTDTIPLGDGPAAIAAGEDAIWVANSREGTVTRIDPATRAVEARIAVGRRPSGIAVGAGAVWVANSLSGTVSRIDRRTNRVAKTIEVGGMPRSVAVAGGRVWVSVQEPPPPSGARARAGSAANADRGRHLEQCFRARRRATAARDLRAPDELREPRRRRRASSCRRSPRPRPRYRTAGAVPLPDPPRLSLLAAIRPTGHRRRVPARDRADAASALELVRGRRSSSPIVGAGAYTAGRADTIAGVRARGDRLTIRLTRPDPTLPARLSTFYFCAVPPNTPIRPRGLERIAAAGPYHVAESTPGSRLVLRRNPSYAGPRPQRLEAIEVEFGLAQERAVPEVEAGRADYALSQSQETQVRLLARYGPGSRAAAAGRQQYFAAPVPAIDALVFNPRRSLFARAATRRAVNYAIDRRALGREPFGGRGGRPTDQHIPPGYPGFRDATIYPLGGPDLAAPGAWPAALGDTACCTRATYPAAPCGPRSCARTGGDRDRARDPAIQHRHDAQETLKPGRALRPLTLHLGWRGPGPVGFHRRHVQPGRGHGIPRPHASGTADTRREPARRRRAARSLRRA